MKILADENIDYPIIKMLRTEGFDVISVFEEHQSISDPNVLQLANELNAIILTNDKDFGDLVFRQKLLHKGIILVRLPDKTLTETAQIIIDTLKKQEHKLSTQFTVIKDKKLKVRYF